MHPRKQLLNELAVPLDGLVDTVQQRVVARRVDDLQARVRHDGKDYYLGPYGSAASKEAYARLIARIMAGDDEPTRADAAGRADSASPPPASHASMTRIGRNRSNSSSTEIGCAP